MRGSGAHLPLTSPPSTQTGQINAHPGERTLGTTTGQIRAHPGEEPAKFAHTLGGTNFDGIEIIEFFGVKFSLKRLLKRPLESGPASAALRAGRSQAGSEENTTWWAEVGPGLA